MGKLPAFMFYPGDWMKDPALRSVSSAARGLWIDMLSLMFECDRRGYLTVNGKAVTAEILARMTGNSTDETHRYLQELDNSGVFSRLDDGTIFSRRQVKDERVREQTRQRVTKHRSNGFVTQLKQPCTEDESETERSSVEVGFEVQEPPIDFNMAGRKVQIECGLAGDKRLLMVTDSVRGYCRLRSVQPEEAAPALVELCKRYEREIRGPFKCRVDKFFESGLWQHPEKWQELANGAREQNKTEQRIESVNRGRAAIVAGLGLGKQTGRSDSTVREGTAAGGSPNLAKLLPGRTPGND